MEFKDILSNSGNTRLEVFFDYICPYCYKGHSMVEEIVKGHPEIKILWRPCEVDPQGKRSRAAIKGLYYLLHHELPAEDYHHAMFAAYFEERKNLNDV